MDRSFTFNITEERYNEIKKYLKNPETVTSFVNNSIDNQIENIKSRYLIDFIWYLGMPTLGFLGMVSICLLYPTLFFFIITIILGVYIVILFYVFYNKYHRRKKV